NDRRFDRRIGTEDRYADLFVFLDQARLNCCIRTLARGAVVTDANAPPQTHAVYLEIRAARARAAHARRVEHDLRAIDGKTELVIARDRRLLDLDVRLGAGRRTVVDVDASAPRAIGPRLRVAYRRRVDLRLCTHDRHTDFGVSSHE